MIRTPIGGSYFTVSRTWKAGNVVRITVPFRLRVEKALDDPTLQTLFHDPVNLVARNSATSYMPFGLYANAALSGDLLPTLSPVSGKPLARSPRSSSAGSTQAWPTPCGPTALHFRRDLGRAPFATKNALVARVRSTVDAWVAAGSLTRADGRSVVNTAQQAPNSPRARAPYAVPVTLATKAARFVTVRRIFSSRVSVSCSRAPAPASFLPRT